MTPSKPEGTVAVMEYSSWVITMLSNFIIYNTQVNAFSVKNKKNRSNIIHSLKCFDIEMYRKTLIPCSETRNPSNTFTRGVIKCMQHPLNCWENSQKKIKTGANFVIRNNFGYTSSSPHIYQSCSQNGWAFCDVTGLYIKKGYDVLHVDTQHFINQLLTFCSLLPHLDAKPSLCHNELEHKGRRSRLPD